MSTYQKWEDLTKEEQDKFNKAADEINKEGLTERVRTIANLLGSGILKEKNGKFHVSGTYAFKMLQEKGIPLELWYETVIKRINNNELPRSATIHP